ncbi:MAG: DUF1707 domain-containing protein [Pseudonocardia sp.]|nr:DUF1707 domain-containing protein [Pseudonocardia sp.]
MESAVGDGRLTLDEFTDRRGRVWAATAPGELVGVLDDLPVPVVGQTASARSTIVCVIGDARRRGRLVPAAPHHRLAAAGGPGPRPAGRADHRRRHRDRRVQRVG